MNIGTIIRTIRKEKGLTMKQLATKIGTSEQAIGNYERGIRNVSITVAKQIATALEIDLNELLNINSTNTPQPNVFIDENGNKIIDYSSMDLKEISYKEALLSFQKLLDYVKFNSNNTRLKTLGHDIDEEIPLLEKTTQYLNEQLSLILFNRSPQENNSILHKGDDLNGKQEK